LASIGNVTSDKSSVSLNQYDLYNRLTGISQDAHEISYTYNPDGLRHSKTVDGNTTTHIWNGTQISAELNGSELYDSGVITNKYIYGLDRLYCENNTNNYYYHYNPHGDVTALTSATDGSLVKTYNYDAFGNSGTSYDSNFGITENSAIVNPFRYCGEYFDMETGSVYLRARYYQPVFGRFVSEDTHWNTGNMIYGDNPTKINESDEDDPLALKTYTYVPDIQTIMQSGNLYVYCMNNPMICFDTSGYKVYVMGVTASAELSASVGGTAYLVFDDKGNVGYMVSASASVGFFGAAASAAKGVLDLDNIYQLKNCSFSASVSIGEALVIGAMEIFDKNADDVGTVITVGVGVGSPLDFNVHPLSATIVEGKKVNDWQLTCLKIGFWI